MNSSFSKIMTVVAIVAILALCGLVSALGGCVPLVKPVKYVDIRPDQTAFAIPYQGDRSNQTQLYSESMLEQNKISVKRYQMPYIWLNKQIGGYWAEGVSLILVDLKPVTRAWTADVNTGTSASNQALVAETRESIGFSSEWNCQAQVNEANAAKFVHYYYGKSLDEVMDQQIRPMVQQVFTAQAATYNLSDTYDVNGKLTAPGFLTHKADVNKAVRDQVVTFFKDRGIDILNLGMQGEITYLNKDIQQSIDKRIQAQNDLLAQQARNQQTRETADALQYQAQKLSGPVAIKLRELDLEKQGLDNQATYLQVLREKWSGNWPTTMMGSSPSVLMQLPQSSSK